MHFSRATQRFMVVSLSFVILIAALSHSFLYVNLGLDDAFISYRYSHNAAQGYGIVWNPNEHPVEGYSNFTWVVLNILPIKLGIHPLLFSKAVGVLASLTMILLVLSPLNSISRRMSTKLSTAMSIALCPSVFFYAQGGLETTFFAALVLLAVLLYWNGVSTGRSALVITSSSAWALASMTRPEGLGLFGITAIFELMRYTLRKRHSPADTSSSYIVQLCLPFFVIWMPYFVWKFNYYGYPFPNTYYAKHSGGGLDQIVLGIAYVAVFAGKYLTVPLAVVVVALFPLLSELSLRTSIARPRSVAAYFTAIVVLFLLYVLYVGGDDISAFPASRLFVPIIPLIFLFVFTVLEWSHRDGRFVFATQLTIGLLVIVNLFPDFNTLIRSANPSLTNSLGITVALQNIVMPRKDVYQEPNLSKWIRERVAKDGLIAVPWAGIIPYYSNVITIDTLGLNDEHIAHLPKRQRGIDVKMDAAYVLSRVPDLIFINVAKDVGLGKMSFAQGGGGVEDWRSGVT